MTAVYEMRSTSWLTPAPSVAPVDDEYDDFDFQNPDRLPVPEREEHPMTLKYKRPDELDYKHDGTQNESRADQIEAALTVATDCNGERAGEIDEVELDVKDLLASVRHFCDRAGLDYGVIDRDAYGAYLGDSEDGPHARRDTERFPERVTT